MEKIFELLMSNPELIAPTVRVYIEKYKPMVYYLAKEVVEIVRDYSNNTDYPAIVAKTKKNLFDAYVAVGFNKDQALALMINDNIQLMNNIKQITSKSSKSMEKAPKV